MKAVMLAGGEGTRLRPISCHVPKPMVPLFGRPVMEHAIRLLASAGIDQIAVTLQTLPYVITDYFGDGGFLGVNLQYAIEKKPLGTAGGVRAFAAFCADDHFFVVSGDAVFDYDLAEAMAFHRQKDADVTLLLSRQASSLLEYGLVMLNENSEVTRFIEKPSWGQVFADTVNTGLYIVNPRVLSLIPENTFFDFAKDLFPLLLARKARLFGHIPEGYWCDMGDSAALKQVHYDALKGKVKVTLPLSQQQPGLWAASPIPRGVHITTPCYIDARVKLAPGAQVGPYAVIGDGSVIEAGAVVENSVLDCAHVGARSVITGAYLAKNVVLREGVQVEEEAVLADDVLVDAHARIGAGARVWPGKEIESGSRVVGSLTSGQLRHGALFGGDGRLTGQPHVDLTPEFCLRLGSSAASSFGVGISIAWQGGNAARLTAYALETGICAAGQTVTRHDASFAACAAYAAALYRFPLSIFVCQRDEQLTLHWFGSDGLPIPRADERRIETIAARGEFSFRDAQGVGSARQLSGIPGLYGRAAATPPGRVVPTDGLNGFKVVLASSHTADEALLAAFDEAGADIHRSGEGMLSFSVDEDGLEANALDEDGRPLSHAHLLGCLVLLEAVAKESHALAVPYAAPAFLDELAADQGLHLLRHGRDGQEAASLLAGQIFARDGIFLCLRIAHGLVRNQTTLSALYDRLPPFHAHSVEIGLSGDRGAVMRVLAESCRSSSPELVEGLRARVAGGWVHVSPLPNRRALRVTGEGDSAEIAEELCNLFTRRARTADGSVVEPKI